MHNKNLFTPPSNEEREEALFLERRQVLRKGILSPPPIGTLDDLGILEDLDALGYL